MVAILTQAAKFITLFFMILYTVSTFNMLRMEDRMEQLGNYRMNNVLIFLLHFSCYAAIFLHDDSPKVILFYGVQVAFLVLFLLFFRLFYKESHLLLLNNTCMLLVIGMAVLTRLNYDKAVKQFVIMCAAAVVSLIIPKLMNRLKVSKVIAGVLGVIGIVLLGLVLVLSRTTYGANLSLSYRGISVQPSEFVKVSYVLLIAMLFRKRNDFARICFAALIALGHTGILVLSRDLGGALIYCITFICMLYVASGKKRYPIAGVLALCGGAVVAYYLFSHVRVRVTAWLDPWSVIEKEGYQITQSLFSIANGSWFGLGLYEGVPGYIPVVEKDFIFSAIAEELGTVFCLCLIAVCLNMLLAMLKIATKLSVIFYKLIGVGLASLYGVQVFLTVGGAIKMIPSTGVTLPLVSYGGSSMLATFIILGVLQSLYIKGEQIEQAHALEKQLKAATTETRKLRKDGTLVVRRKVKKPNKTQQRILNADDTKNAPSTKRNREAYRIGYLYIALFLSMGAYMCYFVFTVDDTILENPYNLARVEANSSTIVRGDIVSSDGVVLATTRTGENGEEERYYPYDNLFAHTVGYAGKTSSGIENMANFYLLNSTASFSEQISADLKGEKLQGDSVVSTINSHLQYTAYQAMGGFQGAVVVMEADTGKILAMVSKPDYNPNTMDAIWNSLSYLDSSESFLVNRATQGQYPPGSTFKLITTLAYMRQFPDSYQEFMYDCTGSLAYENGVINCSENHAHGLVDIMHALEGSCNGAFASMAATLDNQTLMEVCDSLLFNQELPVSIRYKQSSFPIQIDSVSTERMMIGIGQGKLLMSPLHSVMITSAIANGGNLMTPYLIDRVVAGNGMVVEQFTPQKISRVMTEQETQILEEFMIATVEEGTGYLSASPYYHVAGKTGSAQYSSSLTDLHAWYTGYAWQEDGKKIAVSVILEGAGSGGRQAAPVAKQIFDAYFGVEEEDDAATE